MPLEIAIMLDPLTEVAVAPEPLLVFNAVDLVMATCQHTMPV
jgi:hypothetical protein